MAEDGLEWAGQPRGTIRWTAIALAVLIAAILAGGLFAGAPLDRASPLLGRPAPEVSGVPLRGGPPDLEDWRGRWMLVNFSAPWCTQCHVELPHLRALARAEPDLRLVTVITGSHRDEAERFLDREAHPWSVVWDHDGRTGVAYGHSTVPESYLITPTGVVAAIVPHAIEVGKIREWIGSSRRA